MKISGKPRARRVGPPVVSPSLSHIAPDLQGLAYEVIALNPSPNNARLHDLAADIPVLMESLRRFGQRKAIVAKKTYFGVPDAVLAGNGTLLAAQQLDWTHLAVSWFDGSDQDAQEYALLDNRTAELSEWKPDELETQLKAIRARGNHVTALGWDVLALASLLDAANTVPAPAAGRGATPGDETPEFRSVKFTLDQWAVVLHAVTKMRRREGESEMSPSRAVELLCADFNSGPDYGES